MARKEHKIAGLRIKRVSPSIPAPDLGWSPKDDLPDLEPAERKLGRVRDVIFRSDRITLSRGSVLEDNLVPSDRAEHKDIIARITVYVLNITVMIMSLPVGLALLYFNIMGGENLRTTAHVMALTGMFMALAATAQGAALFATLSFLN